MKLKKELVDVFLKKHNLTEADYRNLQRFQEIANVITKNVHGIEKIFLKELYNEFTISK